MTSKAKIAIGIIAVIVVIVLVNGFKKTAPKQAPANGDTKEESVAQQPLSGTGSVDDVINGLTADTQAESVTAQNVTDESNLVTSDTGSINDLGNSYDENNF